MGIDVGIGGNSNESIISGITGLLMHVTFILSLSRILVCEFLGKWNKKLDKKYTRLMEKGFDVPLTELERQLGLLEKYRPRFV